MQPNIDRKEIIEFFEKSKEKGLLLYYENRIGKTLTSISIAQNMINSRKCDCVYFISQIKERLDWIEKYCKKMRVDNIKFNDFNLTAIEKNSLVVIDESHEFISRVFTDKKIFKSWILIKNSDCRVLAVSNKPVQTPKEWVVLCSILAPSIYGNITLEKNGKHYLDESKCKKIRIDFSKIKNIVYYKKGENDPAAGVVKEVIIKCKMSCFQFEKYYNCFCVKKDIKPFTKSRQLSNISYMSCHQQKADVKISEFEYIKKLDENEMEIVYKNKGWLPEDPADLNLVDMSKKIINLFLNISNNYYDGKHIIYSSFVKKHGLNFIKYLCDINKIPYVNLIVDPPEYSADSNVILLSEMQLNKMNDSVSYLENIKYIHIVESDYTNIMYNKLIDAIKNSPDITVYKYHSVFDSCKENIFIDEILYSKNNEKKNKILEFLECIKQTSVVL
jgi:hypothetical protein